MRTMVCSEVKVPISMAICHPNLFVCICSKHKTIEFSNIYSLVRKVIKAPDLARFEFRSPLSGDCRSSRLPIRENIALCLYDAGPPFLLCTVRVDDKKGKSCQKVLIFVRSFELSQRWNQKSFCRFGCTSHFFYPSH